MIHMAQSFGTEGLSNIKVVCRCGWTTGPFDTITEARKAGDAHLAEANG